MSQSIFVLEDDADIRRLVQYQLEGAGYAVRVYPALGTILQDAERQRPALFLLDIMVPGGDGLDLCRRLRQNPTLASVPVIFVTARASENDRVAGLELGADDYITKPFSMRELLARVKAVLRRFERPEPAGANAVLTIGTLEGRTLESRTLEIDGNSMQLRVNGELVTTTATEFRLLDYLARHPGRVFSRDHLLDAVWGDARFVTPRSVDVYVRRIREKIEADPETPRYLKTMRGAGVPVRSAEGEPRCRGWGCGVGGLLRRGEGTDSLVSMGAWLKRSLFMALLWRAAIAAGVAGVAVLLLPRPWMVAVAALSAAAWLAAAATYTVSNALEELEPLAATVVGRQGPLPEPTFQQMEGIVDALNVSSVESARRLEASSESRRKLEALLDSMQDAVTSVDAAGRIVWANRPMQRLMREASGSVRAGHSLVQTIRSPEVLRCVQQALEQGRFAEERTVSMPVGRVFRVSASPMPEGGGGGGDAGPHPDRAGGARAAGVRSQRVA